jgi:uncharacterized protein (UPF0332 family)
MQTERDLSKHRLAQARQCMESARTLCAANDYKGAANRAYYCAFHCMRSVMALERIDFKKHSAVIAHFRKEYVRTGIFDSRLSKIIEKLFELRAESDYDDYYVVAKADVSEQLANAEYFYGQIKAYLDKEI